MNSNAMRLLLLFTLFAQTLLSMACPSLILCVRSDGSAGLEWAGASCCSAPKEEDACCDEEQPEDDMIGPVCCKDTSLTLDASIVPVLNRHDVGVFLSLPIFQEAGFLTHSQYPCKIFRPTVRPPDLGALAAIQSIVIRS